jgi:predicted Zn-dependent peptidase
MIYNINNLNKELKDTAFHVYNYILGAGGITSKLYKSLRTDNSLCYGVRSLYLKYDELLIVQVSLDKENVKLAEKLIKKIISDLKNNSVSKNELENAIKNLIFALKMNSDDNVALLNNYMFNYLDELPLIEERIELIKNTKEEDIIKCANSLVLNTIYVLDAGDNNERD